MDNKDNLTTWKKYAEVHSWLRNKFGKANKCESSECWGTSKKYEWAKKKDKTYDFNKDNFWQLCKSCHTIYDSTPEGRKKIADAQKLRIRTKERKCKRCHVSWVGYFNQKFCNKCAKKEYLDDKERWTQENALHLKDYKKNYYQENKKRLNALDKIYKANKRIRHTNEKKMETSV